ncbi:Lrp/AsnC family transcriptional regulator [Neotabrizicola sp. sgz301269]|uniref:Lrp/AsnC family transcriptional regulator n=1 Tax=Neotabrizicola sp. sgz301269 TaxID=3276282 RepID=UPI00376F7F8D
MNVKQGSLDVIDLRLLTCLQRDAALSQRDLANQLGISQNACWRRLHALQSAGILAGSQARVDLAFLGLDLTIYVMIQTREHSKDWSETFKRRVQSLPEVVDVHRIGGEWDYMLRVVTAGMQGYDRFYQKLIDGLAFNKVTGLFSMERIMENRPVDLNRLL